MAISLTLLILFSESSFGQSNKKDLPYLVVLSMDGFRWDYPDSVVTPNLRFIAKNGVKAKSIIPSFPSQTFPNHYTLATGLYPDHHGLVQNQFYDPVLKLTFLSSNRDLAVDGRFYGGEPIWVTAEKQNVKSACFYWVGSESIIENVRPSYWEKYNPTISFENRIDTIIHWLSLPLKERPHLLMFYFDQPDRTAHMEGPFSVITKNKIAYVDSLVGVFMNKIRVLPIANQVNFIITSDHGMGKVNDSMKICLDKYVSLNWVLRVNGRSPMLMIDAQPGYKDSIKFRISKISHLKIWDKHEVPSFLHYGTNSRIGELVLLADSGYVIGSLQHTEKGGTHGYDPVNIDMHGIFYAIGPAFKKGYMVPSFENIHVYALMAEILGIVPAKNDGDLKWIKDVLSVNK